MLQTARLVLRLHQRDDFDDMNRLWTDVQAVRFVGLTPNTPSEVWRRLMFYRGHWEIEGYGFFAVEERTTGRFVGEMGFCNFLRGLPETDGFAEAGWFLMPEYHGKGYASEAMLAASEWLRNQFGPRRTVCLVHPENEASIALATRLGYRQFGATHYREQPANVYERML